MNFRVQLPKECSWSYDWRSAFQRRPCRWNYCGL